MGGRGKGWVVLRGGGGGGCLDFLQLRVQTVGGEGTVTGFGEFYYYFFELVEVFYSIFICHV